MPPTNRAVILSGAKEPLLVQDTSYTAPGPQELVIKTYAVAVDAVDAYKQVLGDASLPYIKLPCVPGNDVAGQVVEVGSAVRRFQEGDRICAEAAGTADFGRIQEYVVLREHLTARILDSIAYEQAAVLPLGFSTAAYWLFHTSTLALNVPSINVVKNRKTLLITSGASSVGANAIHLAVAAGYDVYSTASPKNFDLIRQLGAKDVFDYNDQNAFEKLIATLKDQKLVGALAINAGGVKLAGEVLSNKDSLKFIADAGPPPTEGHPEGIQCKFFIPDNLGEPQLVVGRIWRDFLPQALAAGSFVARAEPLVIGKGLEAIQGAYERVMKPVSAQKVVVTF